MRKFSRGLLILLLVAVLSSVGSYLYEFNTIKSMYKSVAQLYIVPGEANEATLRADDGGLKDDFAIVFNSDVVISAAKKTAGTSEEIEKYLTVNTIPNSNIVELVIVNPDQNTAKTYVDAIAATAVKTTSIIPVESIQILSEGTSTGVSFKPDLFIKTVKLAATITGIAAIIEILVLLFYLAFRKRREVEDEYYDYEKNYEKKGKKRQNKDEEYVAPNVSKDAFDEIDNYFFTDKGKNEEITLSNVEDFQDAKNKIEIEKSKEEKEKIEKEIKDKKNIEFKEDIEDNQNIETKKDIVDGDKSNKDISNVTNKNLVGDVASDIDVVERKEVSVSVNEDSIKDDIGRLDDELDEKAKISIEKNRLDIEKNDKSDKENNENLDTNEYKKEESKAEIFQKNANDTSILDEKKQEVKDETEEKNTKSKESKIENGKKDNINEAKEENHKKLRIFGRVKK